MDEPGSAPQLDVVGPCQLGSGPGEGGVGDHERAISSVVLSGGCRFAYRVDTHVRAVAFGLDDRAASFEFDEKIAAEVTDASEVFDLVAVGSQEFFEVVLEGGAVHLVDLVDAGSSDLDGPLDSSRSERSEDTHDYQEDGETSQHG
jgi:hypothetical protein